MPRSANSMNWTPEVDSEILTAYYDVVKPTPAQWELIMFAKKGTKIMVGNVGG